MSRSCLARRFVAARLAATAVALAAAAAAVLPSAAVAAAPSLTTSFTESLAPTQARIVGEISTGGEATTYRAEYDTAGSAWCTDPTGGPAFTTDDQALAASADPVVVSVTLDGLVAGTEYCVALEAANASAPAGVRSTPPELLIAGAPDTAESAAAGGTSPSTARLAIDVWPAGQSTSVSFRWAPASSAFCTSDGTVSGGETTVAPQVVGPANAWTTVSSDIGGLATGQAYCFVSSVENASIAGNPIEELWTLTTSRTAATTGEAVEVGATSATLTGTVNPGGIETYVSFEYAVAASPWCASGGTSGDADHETHPQAAGAASAHQPARAVVTELLAQTAYCFRVVARNDVDGIVRGATAAFTTGAVGVPAPPAPTPTVPWADPPAAVVAPLGSIYVAGRDAGRRIERVRGAVRVGVGGSRLTVEVLTRGAVRGIRGSAQRGVRIGRFAKAVVRPGIVGFSIRLSSAARRALRAKRTAKVLVRVTVTAGSARSTRTLPVTLRSTAGAPATCGRAAVRLATAAGAGLRACPAGR